MKILSTIGSFLTGVFFLVALISPSVPILWKVVLVLLVILGIGKTKRKSPKEEFENRRMQVVRGKNSKVYDKTIALINKYSNFLSTPEDKDEWLKQLSYMKARKEIFDEILCFAEEVYNLYLNRHYPELAEPIDRNRDYIYGRLVVTAPEEETAYISGDYYDIMLNKKDKAQMEEKAKSILERYKNCENIKAKNLLLGIPKQLTSGIEIPLNIEKVDVYQ